MEIKNYIPAFWYSSNNFGDALNHYIIRKISGKTPVLVESKNPCEKVMCIGSILNNSVENCIVWGAGLAFSTNRVTPKKEILAVRGKLTGELLKGQGIPFNEVYGDPCLLLPRLYNVDVAKKYKLGVMPHYVDTQIVYDKLGMSDSELEVHGIKILDIQSDIEDVVRQVKSCEKIISSTLHGLIVSDAYGVPSEWVKFSNGVGGDDFKYADYYSSINSSKRDFLDFRGDNLNLNALINNYSSNATPNYLDIDLDKLWEACPFKK